MSFVAAATTVFGEGLAATIATGAMMGGAMKVGTNVLSGKGAFDNIGQGILMGGITGGIAPEVAEALNISTAAAAGLTSGALTGLATGSLSQGLMTGLGTWGLASLPGASTEGGGGTGDTTYQIRNASGTSMDPSVSKFSSPTPEPSLDTSRGYEIETTTPLSQPNNEPSGITGTQQFNQTAAQQPDPFSQVNESNYYKQAPSDPFAAQNNAAPNAPQNTPSQVKAPASNINPDTGKPYTMFESAKKFAVANPWTAAGVGAAGLMALKGAAKSNTVTKAPDNRRLKFFGGNPYSGASSMYETPVLAANGGIVALAKGGRIENGVRRFDVAGSVDAAIGAGQAGFAPGTSAQDVVTNYGLNAQQARQVAQVLGYTGDLSGLSYAPSVSAVPSISNAVTAAAPVATAAATPAAQSAAVQAAIGAGQAGFAPGTSAQDVITNFNLNQDQAKQVAQALGYTGDLNGLTYNTPTTTKAPSLLGLAALDASITGNPNATPAQAGQVAIDRTYLNGIMNPSAADVASVAGESAANKAALINKAINAANNIYGGNNAVSQKVIAQLMDVWKINPDTVQSALGDKYTGPSVQSLYSAVDPALAMGVTSSWANQGAYATPAAVDNTKTDTKIPLPNTITDPTVISNTVSTLGLPKGTYKTMADVYNAYAASLGLPAGSYGSIAEITKAAMAAQVTPKTPTPTTQPAVNLAPVVNLKPTTTTTPSLDKNGYYVPATAPTATSNGQTYNAGYISNTANPTTAQGVGGSHAFVNANGYISQAPAMPFRPLGGYGTLQAAKDAWTQSGGSLGHVNPKPVAHNIDAGTQHYLDVLSGDAPASKIPYTPTGEIAKPYYTSVMGMAENPKYTISQPKIYDSSARRYVDNPNYDPAFSATADYVGAYSPGYTGEAAPALDPKTIAYLKGQGVNVGEPAPVVAKSSSTSTSGAPVTLPNKVTATPLTNYPGYLKGTDGKYYDKVGNKIADTEAQLLALIEPAANGGLMGLAGGGLGNLGGYSDGGRLLRGPGDGISDSIPATIGARNPQPARLADGEFVVPARIVSELGNGSTEAGARKLYQMMDRVQNARKKTTGKKQVAANPRAEQYLPV